MRCKHARATGRVIRALCFAMLKPSYRPARSERRGVGPRFCNNSAVVFLLQQLLHFIGSVATYGQITIRPRLGLPHRLSVRD